MSSRPWCRRVAVDRNSILPLHAPYLSFPVIAFLSQTLRALLPFPHALLPIIARFRSFGSQTGTAYPSQMAVLSPRLQLIISPILRSRPTNTRQQERFPQIFPPSFPPANLVPDASHFNYRELPAALRGPPIYTLFFALSSFPGAALPASLAAAAATISARRGRARLDR